MDGAVSNRHGAIDLDFADGTYTFRLALAQIEELESRTERGLFTLARDLHPDIRTVRTGHIVEVLRIGLVGGGLAPVKALQLTRRYGEATPLDELRDLAYAVVVAALARAHGEEQGGALGEEGAAETTGSTSPLSTPRPS